ncbi:hypothetical protein [Enterobacter hormaechei]|uniref:hypothetical protein n=1 Tax=Enterobacter hormaechei TaxID=158836 RepID=UPI0007B3CD66|nr:hypothetical protein [Enterobacter hormaechei]KZP84548.1 hypothetical protein A3N47_10135 [Enterobacter hormaechei subsp. xiangfangensis]
MAESEKNRVADDPQATLDIINTIERTSKKELDVLLSIDKKLSDTTGRAGGRSSGNPKPDRPPAREPANEQKISPHKRRASGASTPLTREERDEGLRVTRRKPRHPGAVKRDQEILPHKNERQVTTATKRPQKSESKASDKETTTSATVAHKPEEPTQKRRTYADQVRKRDGNGRFTSSADKARQKHQDDQHEELVDEEKKSRTLFSKLTGFLTKKDPKEMEGTALDAAGAAAGGSFWKAGKEAMELVKNTGEMLGIGKDNDEKTKKSLLGRVKGLFGKEKKKLPAAVAPAENDYTPSLSKRNGAPAILRATASPTDVGGFGLRNATRARATASSLDVTNRNVQKAAIVKTEEQTQVIKEGDAQIVERLDELLEKSGGAKKGGGLLAKLLGAKIAGKLGKALAGIAGLWVAKFGKKLFSALLAAIAAASAGFRKSLPGRNPRNVDIDADGRGGQGKNKPKKNKPSGKSKGNIFKKLLTNPAVTTAATAVAATAATGAAVASHSGATPEEKPKKGSKPKATPKTAAEAAQESAEKAKASAPKPGDKVSVGRPITAEEGVAKKAGQSVATEVAEKGAVEVAEKGGVKAAAKGAAKIGMRSIPILGTAIMTAVDAVDGYSDEEAQREAFQLKDGEEVTTGQKASFSAANVLDMGGLVSGAAGLLADGAEALGMDGVADALKFDTGDMAKGINSAATSAKDAITNLFSDKSDSKSESQTKTITDSIKEGAKDTITALDSGNALLIDAINKKNGVVDANVVPQQGLGISSPAPVLINAPSTDTMTEGLNIGGRNAKNRSFRNNNFGNLEFAGQAGAVLENKNSKGEQRFARFNTPEEGMRGLGNQLMLYATGRSKSGKRDTIDSILNVFAPNNENNTEAYKASLAKSLGVDRNATLDLANPEVMTKMIRSIATIEGGNPQVTDEFIKKALGTYNFDKFRWEGGFNDITVEMENAKRKAKGEEFLKAEDLYSIGDPMTGRGQVSKATSTNQTPQPSEVKPQDEPEQHAQAAKAVKKQEITPHNVEPEKQGSTATAANAQPSTTATAAPHPEEKTPQSAEISDEKQLEDLTKKAAANSQNGEKYNAAKLPFQDNPIVGKVLSMVGADRVANAEGLRHQAAPGSNAIDRAIASQQNTKNSNNAVSSAPASTPASAIAKPQTVTGVASYSHPKEMYSVTDLQSATPAVPGAAQGNHKPGGAPAGGEVDLKMLAALNKIAGLLEDIKKDGLSSDPTRFTSVKNSPQPAPRATIPLSVSDPTMSSLASR